VKQMVLLAASLAVAVALQLSSSQGVSAQGSTGPHSPLYPTPPMLS
jgi:hypothetical protein